MSIYIERTFIILIILHCLDRGVFRVQTFVTQTEVNDPSNQLRDEIINGKLVVNAKSGIKFL